MTCSKEELIRQLPDHHLVVRPAEEELAFLAYTSTHQFSLTLNSTSLPELRWVDSLQELYEYLRDHEGVLRITGSTLIITFLLGWAAKEISLSMKCSVMPKEKAVKMSLKIASWQYRQTAA